MYSYKNIGIFDLRKGVDEMISSIHEMVNIGTLVVLDSQLSLVSKINQKNIGSVVVLPSDEVVELIVHNGDFHIDGAFLQGLLSKRVFVMINGALHIAKDVLPEQFECFYKIEVNGEVQVPRPLKAAFTLKAHVNGEVQYYDLEDTLVDSPFYLKEESLWSFKPETVIRTDSLIALEPLDLDAIKETFKQFKVNEVISTQQRMRELATLIEDFHKVEKRVIPDGYAYFNKLTLTDESLATLEAPYLYVTGKLVVKPLGEAGLEALSNVKGIICGECHVAKAHLETLKIRLVKVEKIKVLAENVKENYGKMLWDLSYLTSVNKVQLSNYGKLDLAEDVPADVIKEALEGIENYGVISCNQEQYGPLMSKVSQNYGHIKVNQLEGDKGVIDPEWNEEKVTTIANLGRYAL